MHALHRAIIYLLAALALVAVAGCSSAEPTPTPEPTAAPTAVPTSTAAPATATPEPEPAAAPTPEPAASSAPIAPDLKDTGGWINSDPFTLANMQDEGKVVLIDFWTYTCINCIRTLPYLKAWDDKYSELGLVILGVHTPEFEFEKDYDNVVEAVEKFGLEYPIVQDNDFGTWRAFENRYWPAKYLIDTGGRIRYFHFGEGAYDETELMIREILTESGYDVSEIAPDTDPGPPLSQGAEDARGSDDVENFQTRELYAGYERNYGTLMSGGVPPYVLNQEYYDAPNAEVMYTDPGEHRNHFMYLQGLWLNAAESLNHARETADLEDYVVFKFVGTSVNAVMSPAAESAPYDVVVYLDDAPVPETRAGSDIMYDDDGNSFVQVDTSRVYYLLDQPEFGAGEMRLSSNSADFTLFALTFGSYDGGEPAGDS